MRMGRHVKPRGRHIKPEIIMEPNKYARCSVDDGPLDVSDDWKTATCDTCQRTYDMKTRQAVEIPLSTH